MTAVHIAGAVAPPNGQYDADIIILAQDRVEETLAAIASAGSQTGVSVHIFVLDQGSSPTALVRFAEAAGHRTNATLLAVTSNLGVAGGRNLISDLGHGRIIVALDNDAAFATHDTVARMLAALDAEPRLAAIGCRIVTHDDGTDDLSSWGYPANLLPCAGESFDAVTFVGAGHAIRRTAWEQADGYDTKLYFCWEEFDFCLRAIALGWRIRYRGDIVIRHKVAAEHRISWSAGRWYYFVRNRIYIERKQGHPWTALTPRIAGYLLKGVRNGHLPQTLDAIRAARTMSPRSGSPRSGAPRSGEPRSGIQSMPAAAINYLSRNDRAHRGSLTRRLIQEVFGRIVRRPGAALAAKR